VCSDVFLYYCLFFAYFFRTKKNLKILPTVIAEKISFRVKIMFLISGMSPIFANFNDVTLFSKPLLRVLIL
jgi:hypothetical protein